MVTGCATHVPIREHRFTVSDVRESTVQNLERELKAKGYNVRVLDSKPKGEILDEEIKDQTFVIRSDDYTDVDLRNVTALITNPKHEDPIRLKSMEVDQNFVSASGGGSATVKLTVALTENAKAFYKKTGNQIHLQHLSGQQSATFEYYRKPGEEYVDIYIVPEYAEANYKPEKFLRISLSYPYTAEKLPWKPWYIRLWEVLTGKSE
jgi:hypothetical protein